MNSFQAPLCSESCSLAEFIQKLLKDEYWPSGAEDDEGLTTEEAED